MSLKCTFRSSTRYFLVFIIRVNYDRLHDEVKAFLKYISPTDVEDEVRRLVVALITHAVTQAFPDAKVHPFGSFETKLYLPHGCVNFRLYP
jgi:non-canonical poly(A) RNA polymerase PAPD5/7